MEIIGKPSPTTSSPPLVTLTVAELDLGVNCWGGPDISLASLIVLYASDTLEPLGRDPGDSFFAVSIPEKNISECWIV